VRIELVEERLELPVLNTHKAHRKVSITTQVSTPIPAPLHTPKPKPRADSDESFDSFDLEDPGAADTKRFVPVFVSATPPFPSLDPQTSARRADESLS
jgi:hypothetical protein